MSDHGKRLAKLEIRYQQPPESTARTFPPFGPSRLTADELTELEHLLGALDASVAAGRYRLDDLTDDQLHRYQVLCYRGWGMDTTKVEHDWALQEWARQA